MLPAYSEKTVQKNFFFNVLKEKRNLYDSVKAV